MPSFETGHVYGTERKYPFSKPGDLESSDFNTPFDPNFEFEMIKGLEIDTFLQDELGGCQRIWFHDDVIPRQKQKDSQDAWRWQYFMNATKTQVLDRLSLDGIDDAVVQNEFDLISRAEQESIPSILSALGENDVWRYDDNKEMLRGPKIDKKQQRIRLYGYRSYSDIPSCEILDYTFYKKRLESHTPTITLIHQSMRSQQERVRQLFLLSGESNPEVIVLFHDGTEIVDLMYWGIGENKALYKKLCKI